MDFRIEKSELFLMICSPASQVDTMACNGLEFLQNKWLVAKGQTNKVSEELKKYPAALSFWSVAAS